MIELCIEIVYLLPSLRSSVDFNIKCTRDDNRFIQLISTLVSN